MVHENEARKIYRHFFFFHNNDFLPSFLEVDSKEDQEEDEGIDEGEADDNAQEFEDPGILEEIDNTNEDDDGEDDIPDNFDVELDTETADDSLEEKDDDRSEEFAGIPGVNDIDDSSAEPLEEVRFVASITFTRLSCS